MQNYKIKVENLKVCYKDYPALDDINLDILPNEILSIIGPANSGKSTFLKTLNRLNDLTSQIKIDGKILLDGKNVYRDIDIYLLRKKIGIVFALPIPLPLTIFDNVAYGPRLHGIKNKAKLAQIVEKSLFAAYLWDEVKDRLSLSASRLSGGQQQRLCIARTLAVEPEVILYDEPCSGLDPISTLRIEEAMRSLKSSYTQILVTNNVKQAARVGDWTAFFLMGKLIETGTTVEIFTNPKDQRTNDYITGRFG